MISFSNIFGQFISKTVTNLVGIAFSVSKIKNRSKGKKTHIPDSFTPVLRFAVCSDIHLNGEENQIETVRLRQLFEDMYSYSEKNKVYPKLDAVVVAGDFTGGGAEKEYVMFNKITGEYRKEETQLLTVLGNHEFINYRDVDASVGYDIYKKYISDNTDTHTVINGFSFIGVSYDPDGKKFTGKLQWLEGEIEKAVKRDSAKPVFVYQHPAPFMTVYGSVNWGDTDIRKVLKKYPQVVDFSGHSHYAPTDPRSVWQGSFTAVGCGSLAAFMGNLNYIDGDKDAPGKSGGFRLVEADAEGNIRMKTYDSENRMFFDSPEYYFTSLSDVKKRSYTWAQQKFLDTPPVFPENAKVSHSKDDDGNTVLVFPEACGFYEAENYKINVSRSAFSCVFSDTVISDYVRATNNDVFVNAGKLAKGSYKVKITAYSPYAKRGAVLKGVITVNSH
ncbi:MAG: metallophosphoesterase [Ruminococcaceae bacterium]|nr:metallophosphoesterase [Oscillospiraceae bacterium]